MSLNNHPTAKALTTDFPALNPSARPVTEFNEQDGGCIFDPPKNYPTFQIRFRAIEVVSISPHTNPS